MPAIRPIPPDRNRHPAPVTLSAVLSVYRTSCCEIGEEAHYLRCRVIPGQTHEVQDCYRTLAAECLVRKGKSLLIVGVGGSDSLVHLAGRDALRALALAGLPPGFRLALVAVSEDMASVYDTCVREAAQYGIQARRFHTEAQAAAWLSTP